MSNYYQKTETSGATELSTAFSNKADSSSLTSLSGTVTGHTSDTTIHVTSSDKTAWNAKADLSDIPSVTGYADSVKYNSTSKYVEFYHGTTAGTKVFEYDASPFLIDGMVSNVEIKDVTSGSSQVTCLVISFNTDAGKQDINIPISQIFDASNYYTTAQTDTKISEATSGKVDNSTYTAYTSTTATEIGNKLSTSDFNAYSGTVNTELGNKASQSDLNSLSGTVTAHTADTTIHHSHTNKTYLDSISGTVGTMAYQNTTSYSSATQVNTALGNKVDISEYATFSAATNNSIADLSGQSETVAAALVNLNDNKLDASELDELLADKVDSEEYEADSMAIAIALDDLFKNKLDTSASTPVDLSDYYKKSETSGSTEISNALNNKVDTTAFTNHTSSSAHMTTTEKTNLDSLATNIAAISGITSSKVTGWDGAVTNKVDKTEYATFSAATNSSLSDLSDQSETIAVALNDLNDRKADLHEVETLLADKVDLEEYEADSQAISIALNELYKKIQELETTINEIRNS